MSKIPIKNIYYMVLYAWDKINNKNFIANRGIEDINDINDVVIDLFLLEIGRISKKGLYGEYIDNNYDTEFIKGKINVRESIYLIDPKINCRYDKFSKNNRMNQILKSVLNRLYFMKEINGNFKKQIRALLLEFNDEIKDILLDEKQFKAISYNRLNQDYRFSIELGYLIYKNSIPSEKDNIYKFIEIDQDEESMSTIFEEFMRNFYKRHTDYIIRRRIYNWDLEPLDNSNMGFIPRMETDIEIETLKEKIIIDCKYYRNAFITRYDSKKFISTHVYQITAYLRKNINLNEGKRLRGILIYPSNDYEFHERFISKEGYTIEFKTINLNNNWDEIENELLSIIDT